MEARRGSDKSGVGHSSKHFLCFDETHACFHGRISKVGLGNTKDNFVGNLYDMATGSVPDSKACSIPMR